MDKGFENMALGLIGRRRKMETKGKWEVADETSIFCRERLIASAGGFTDNFTSPRKENIANANLICEAVNACKEINDSEPLKVAQSIKDMVEVCKQVCVSMSLRYGYDGDYEQGWREVDREHGGGQAYAYSLAREVLAKIGGK